MDKRNLPVPFEEQFEIVRTRDGRVVEAVARQVAPGVDSDVAWLNLEMDLKAWAGGPVVKRR